MRANDEVQACTTALQGGTMHDAEEYPRVNDEVQTRSDADSHCQRCDHDSTGADAHAPMDWHTIFPPCKWICEPFHDNAQHPSHMHGTWCILYYDSE